MYGSTLYLTLAVEGDEGVSVMPQLHFTPGKDPVLRAGLDRCGKSRPPPGLHPQTVHPIGSRYTDYAARP